MLIVVTIVISLVYSFKLDSASGLDLIGSFGRGFHVPTWPNFDSITSTNVGEIGRTAIVIGMLGFIESIIGCKVYASRHLYEVSPNRELVAYGMANSIASFFGAYPAFGSLTRSALADSAGAKSQV